MTKVLLRFELQSPLTEPQLVQLGDLRGIYGILSFEFDPDSSALAVEYDATRLRAPEVAALLRRHGLPVLPAA